MTNYRIEDKGVVIMSGTKVTTFKVFKEDKELNRFLFVGSYYVKSNAKYGASDKRCLNAWLES